MKNSIEEIWTKVIENDPMAWSKLVDQYSSLIYTVARRAGLDSIESEDCAQHVWIKLYRFRKTIKNAQALPAWLIRTTHRQASYLLRRTARRSELIKNIPESASISTPDETLEALEWQVILLEAMKQMDPRCRKLINSLFIDKEPLTYADLARQLGVSINTLSPLRLRCLNKLRKILEEMGYSLH